MRLHVRAAWTAFVLVLVGSAAVGRPAPTAAQDPITGVWTGFLTIPSGDVRFQLDLRLSGNAVTGSILNGLEAQPFSSGTFDGTTLTMRLDYYDGTLTATFVDASKRALVGEYVRQTSKGIGRYVFHAENRIDGFIPGAPNGKVRPEMNLSGDWVMTVRDKEGKVEEVDDAAFEAVSFGAETAGLSGTIIPVSGDSGLLSGWIEPPKDGDARPRFTMSRFDGIHVTLVTGHILADGTLTGDIASGQSYQSTFTAVRKEKVAAGEAAPEDPFALTSVKNPSEPFAFRLPDPAGKTVSLGDERFRGKVVIVDIFGTWCPNCHDETPLLTDLYKKYNKDGLEIVALAYEYTADSARNARQIDIFRKKYGIDFPILMAGTTGDGEIARTLPQLVNFGAYPTTIFVGRDGRVRKIHAGFSGPATGYRFPAVKREFEEILTSLLAEKPAA